MTSSPSVRRQEQETDETESDHCESTAEGEHSRSIAAYGEDDRAEVITSAGRRHRKLELSLLSSDDYKALLSYTTSVKSPPARKSASLHLPRRRQYHCNRHNLDSMWAILLK
mmetsp:Transcript_27680/g.34227  ORF Transcript_27680/g.34227 Transcript_27680/m.34227 type:complete len:112 (-) Transcript_27680:79-414(-)